MSNNSKMEPFLKRIQDHQKDILNTHQQFLANDAIAKQVINELITAEISLLSNAGDPGKSAADDRRLAILENRAETINHQQSSIADAHKEFVLSQANFTKQYTTLIAQLSGTEIVESENTLTQSIEQKSVKDSPDFTGDVKTQPTELEVVTEEKEQVIPVKQANSLDSEALKSEFLNIVSDKTGYPTNMLEFSMDMEADLGIDSIKRVEILGAMQEKYPDLPTIPAEDLVELRTLDQITDYFASSAPESTTKTTEEIARNPAAPQVPTQATESAISNKELESAFLGIVSDKTGYPTDMLELGMDMEADLGIDSIKRVEILGAMQEQYPSLPTITAEDLVELRTLKQIIDYFSSGPSSSSPKVSASPVSLEPEPKTSETVADIEIREAKIFPLPKPDYLDFQIKPDALVIITDDGNGRAEKLADHFTAQNIRTGLVHFGMLPNGKNSAKSNGRKHYYIPDGSDDTIKTVMENIVAENKDICGFIHLVPHQEQNGSATLAIKDEDTALLKTVFLIARHLGEPLSTSSADGRSVFLAVTSVDGKLGISGSNSFIPVSGGYAGLTKSLRLEWPDVFCRTIDVHPEIKPETFAEIIQSEMHDPDLSISEVGYTPEGRFTIIAE